MVTWVVAIDSPGVRFPLNALKWGAPGLFLAFVFVAVAFQDLTSCAHMISRATRGHRGSITINPRTGRSKAALFPCPDTPPNARPFDPFHLKLSPMQCSEPPEPAERSPGASCGLPHPAIISPVLHATQYSYFRVFVNIYYTIGLHFPARHARFLLCLTVSHLFAMHIRMSFLAFGHSPSVSRRSNTMCASQSFAIFLLL